MHSEHSKKYLIVYCLVILSINALYLWSHMKGMYGNGNIYFNLYLTHNIIKSTIAICNCMIYLYVIYFESHDMDLWE